MWRRKLPVAQVGHFKRQEHRKISHLLHSKMKVSVLALNVLILSIVRWFQDRGVICAPTILHLQILHVCKVTAKSIFLTTQQPTCMFQINNVIRKRYFCLSSPLHLQIVQTKIFIFFALTCDSHPKHPFSTTSYFMKNGHFSSFTHPCTHSPLWNIWNIPPVTHSTGIYIIWNFQRSWEDERYVLSLLFFFLFLMIFVDDDVLMIWFDSTTV